MSLQRQKNLDELKLWFSRLEAYVKANSFVRHQDTNIELENFFRDLLNVVYKWDLGNANQLFGKNQDSFDLSDPSSKIAAQVTVTEGAQKIRKTIKMFVNKHRKKFDRLIFVYPFIQLQSSRANFTNDLKGYGFDQSKDRIGLGDITTKIQDLEIDDQNAALDLIRKELAPLGPKTSSEHSSPSLDDCLAESRARCISRWRGAGLSRREAGDLFDDPHIGKLEQELLDKLTNELVVITGDLGAGKSLIAERIYQRGIEAAKEDDCCPIPLYFQASEVANGFLKLAQDEARKYGNINQRGISFVIDGVDEIDEINARQVLENARIANERWANSSGVITSRKIAAYSDVLEEYALPKKSEEDAFMLVSKVAGHEIQPWGFSKSIIESCRRPLFAILLGLFRRRNTDSPKSTAQLLEFLVTKSLRNSQLTQGDAAAQAIQLAKVCTNQGTLSLVDFDNNNHVEPLISAGILTKSGMSLGFGLPVFCEWFASQALAQGTIDAAELIDRKVLDRWKDALIILSGTNSHDTVMRVLGPIAAHSPGFAATVIDSAIEQWGRDEGLGLPSAIDCGVRIKETLSCFVKGLGDLASNVAPVNEDGNFYQLGVHQDGRRLSVGWSRTRTDPPVVQMVLPGKSREVLGREWPDFQWATPASEAAWAWQWTHRMLAVRLSNLVKNRTLPMKADAITREQAWKELCKMIGQSEGSDKPIPTQIANEYLARHDEFEERVRQEFARQGHFSGFTALASNVNLEVLRGFLETHKGQEINPVHPLPDLENKSHWPWKGYSDSQLLALIRSVITGAMDDYQRITMTSIGNLHRHMNLANILPAKFIGRVFYPGGENSEMFGHQPWMSYLFEPLPEGSENQVSVEFDSDSTTGIGSERTRGFKSEWEMTCKMLEIYRSDKSGFLNPHFVQTVVDYFNAEPVTKLVYAWLEEDLRKISFFE